MRSIPCHKLVKNSASSSPGWSRSVPTFPSFFLFLWFFFEEDRGLVPWITSETISSLLHRVLRSTTSFWDTLSPFFLHHILLPNNCFSIFTIAFQPDCYWLLESRRGIKKLQPLEVLRPFILLTYSDSRKFIERYFER